MIKITTPFTKEDALLLKVGDQVLLSGTIYTGRDAAHKRLIELIKTHQELPFDVYNQIIYYVGPTPEKPGYIFGSGGPTTSGRMDAYAPTLLSLGLRGMIGKGYRNQAVKDAMIEHCGVYFGAIGGAGAFIGQCVESCEIIAFEDLGPEAIRKLYVKDFPLTVIIDAKGNDLYEIGKQNYLGGQSHEDK
ncbi:MAG: Fe-S-containing hydro-lyase [Coprobacillus sp.]